MRNMHIMCAWLMMSACGDWFGDIIDPPGKENIYNDAGDADADSDSDADTEAEGHGGIPCGPTTWQSLCAIECKSAENLCERDPSIGGAGGCWMQGGTLSAQCNQDDDGDHCPTDCIGDCGHDELDGNGQHVCVPN